MTFTVYSSIRVTTSEQLYRYSRKILEEVKDKLLKSQIEHLEIIHCCPTLALGRLATEYESLVQKSYGLVQTSREGNGQAHLINLNLIEFYIGRQVRREFQCMTFLCSVLFLLYLYIQGTTPMLSNRIILSLVIMLVRALKRTSWNISNSLLVLFIHRRWVYKNSHRAYNWYEYS